MDNVIFEDHFTQYAISASREYQEIHPYSAVNIDSVKINTSLIMMKEWLIMCLTCLEIYLYLYRADTMSFYAITIFGDWDLPPTSVAILYQVSLLLSLY